MLTCAFRFLRALQAASTAALFWQQRPRSTYKVQLLGFTQPFQVRTIHLVHARPLATASSALGNQPSTVSLERGRVAANFATRAGART